MKLEQITVRQNKSIAQNNIAKFRKCTGQGQEAITIAKESNLHSHFPIYRVFDSEKNLLAR